jgi:hypothetical protein
MILLFCPYMQKKCETFSTKLLKEGGLKLWKDQSITISPSNPTYNYNNRMSQYLSCASECPSESHKSDVDNSDKHIRLENIAIKETQNSYIIEQLRNK